MIYSQENSIPLLRQTVSPDKKYISVAIEEIKKQSRHKTVYGLAIVTREIMQRDIDGHIYTVDCGIKRVSHKRLFDKPLRSQKAIDKEKQDYLSRYKSVPA